MQEREKQGGDEIARVHDIEVQRRARKRMGRTRNEERREKQRTGYHKTEAKRNERKIFGRKAM